jgi:hypothetical protein
MRRGSPCTLTPLTITNFDEQLIVKKTTFPNAASSRSQCGMAPIKNASCLRSPGSQMISGDAVRDERENKSHPEAVKIT